MKSHKSRVRGRVTFLNPLAPLVFQKWYKILVTSLSWLSWNCLSSQQHINARAFVRKIRKLSLYSACLSGSEVADAHFPVPKSKVQLLMYCCLLMQLIENKGQFFRGGLKAEKRQSNCVPCQGGEHTHLHVRAGILNFSFSFKNCYQLLSNYLTRQDL